ncbi:MAG: c-type cytochrome [Sulfurimonas sp.]|jgi:cytochrome c|nr:c-type cytochrome [Sulfurimonas sp.]
MKKIVLGLSVTMLLLTDVPAQETGEVLFESKGCVLCHKKDEEAIGPSLRNIANVYAGKEMALLTYLKGQGTPIVDPARASVMEPQLVKIRMLFEEDLHAISKYIIHSNR